MKTTTANQNPRWWTEKNESSWDHVKEAFARDWEQTKADFSKSAGRELDQNVADTVKQAAGKQAIPSATERNPKPKSSEKNAGKRDFDFNSAEPALRYGYGASSQFATHKEWDTKLETELRGDWDNLRHDRSWDEVKEHVRRGWNHARKQS